MPGQTQYITKTLTPKKVFVNRTNKSGQLYPDGKTQVTLLVHSTTGEDAKIRALVDDTEEIPVEGVQTTLKVYQNGDFWNFVPNKAPSLSEINRKLDLILSYVTGRAPEPTNGISSKDQEIIDNL